MCIIVYKPANTDMPDVSVFERCFEANSDGAGFMFRHDGRIEIRKGFLTFESLIAALEDEPLVSDWKSTEVGIHFRFATHGAKDVANCHPFPVSTNTGTLRASHVRARAALMHNGIIPEFSSTKSVASDTRLFVKVLADMRNIDENAQFLLTGRGKFLLMTVHKTILVGHFEEEAGVKYSNDGYREPITYVYEENARYVNADARYGASYYTRGERKRFANVRDCQTACQKCPARLSAVDVCIETGCEEMDDIIDDDLHFTNADNDDDVCAGCNMTPKGSSCTFWGTCTWHGRTHGWRDEEQDENEYTANTDLATKEALARAARVDADAVRNGKRLLGRMRADPQMYAL